MFHAWIRLKTRLFDRHELGSIGPRNQSQEGVRALSFSRGMAPDRYLINRKGTERPSGDLHRLFFISLDQQTGVPYIAVGV
jgi:hypothetical protein